MRNNAIRLSKSQNPDLGLFGILPADVSKTILSKLAFSDRSNIRLVCRSWALFADSHFVRRCMARSMIPWIIENFKESLNALPIEAEELCEFLNNDSLKLKQKIVGLNDLPEFLLWNKPSFPRDFFLNSREKIKKIRREIYVTNTGFFDRETIHCLNKIFYEIQLFLIHAFRLSLPKFEKDITYLFEITDSRRDLIPMLVGKENTKTDEIIEIHKKSEILGDNFSEIYLRSRVSEFPNCNSLKFTLPFGLIATLVASILLALANWSDYGNDIKVIFGFILIGLGVLSLGSSVVTCFWRRNAKNELINLLQSQKDEIQKIAESAQKNKSEIFYPQDDEVRINIEGEKLLDNSNDNKGSGSSEEAPSYHGLFQSKSGKGKEEENEDEAIEEALFGITSDHHSINDGERQPLFKK